MIKISMILKNRPGKAVFAVLALILFLTAVFLCRKPVILVTDRPFTVLYGEKRARIKQITLSLRLFRRIRTINVAEGAGPDIVAQGAAGLSRRPWAVLFPYRYRESARQYLQARPGFRVVILGGRRSPTPGGAEIPEPLWLCTDTETDLYRAGVLAGIAARAKADTGGIALYGEGLGEAEKTAFSRGVAEQWSGTPLFSPDPSDAAGIACAVAAGNYHFSREEAPQTVVLFTWMDPALAPRNTLAVFDDSPWVQLPLALNFLKTKAIGAENGAGGLIPSHITLLGGGKALKKEYIAINSIKSLNYMGEKADN